MELRLTVQREVMDKLDSTHFTSDDFIVSFGNTEGFDDLIDIKFKHNDKEKRGQILWYPHEFKTLCSMP